jgi:hypothetical protein
MTAILFSLSSTCAEELKTAARNDACKKTLFSISIFMTEVVLLFNKFS